MSKPYIPIPLPEGSNFTGISAWWRIESERILTGCDFVLVQGKKAWAVEIESATQRGGGRKAVKDWGMWAATRAGAESPQIGEAKLMPEGIICRVERQIQKADRFSIQLDVYLVDNHTTEWNSIKARR